MTIYDRKKNTLKEFTIMREAAGRTMFHHACGFCDFSFQNDWQEPAGSCLSLGLNTQNGIKVVSFNYFYWPAEIRGLKYKACYQSKGPRREERTLIIL